ncbi:hypothetical protein A1O3_05601 [Capronia epimyces CBS 606.96]|uniref:Uncharacterized protein n=1 Tax=Capronia epimyces CBS 606.96 TaxID=1182542 RepID=W9Y6T1_9EURO|nr:uncharacterized protein A1O3_05601 [Capronia epimyces CBS 606.96]EXJ84926.1 hypothetical protein A1O3_05601 [Capronia epimyces CBS 606.96]
MDPQVFGLKNVDNSIQHTAYPRLRALSRCDLNSWWSDEAVQDEEQQGTSTFHRQILVRTGTSKQGSISNNRKKRIRSYQSTGIPGSPSKLIGTSSVQMPSPNLKSSSQGHGRCPVRRQTYTYSVHVLKAGASKTALQPILDLSNRIFDTTLMPPTHHSSLDEWHTRLSSHSTIGGAILVSAIATTDLTLPSRACKETTRDFSSSPTSEIEPVKTSWTTDDLTAPSSTSGPEPVGFIFAIPKTSSSLPCPTLHIWLAGVADQARGTGVFAALMSEVEKHARGDGIGVDQVQVQALTVCTFPARFGRMFAILQKQGWDVRERMDDGKVLMMKGLGVGTCV